MKPSFFFQHSWSQGKLVSSVKVEDLLDADHDIYTLTALLDSEDDLQWYWFSPDRQFKDCDADYFEIDRNRAAYIIASYHDRLRVERYHIGECVGIECSCTRCITEDAYLKAFELVRKSLVLNKGGMSDLLAITMAYEGKFQDRKRYADLYIKSRLEKDPTENAYAAAFKLFPMPSGDIESRIDYWNFLDPIHQNYYRNRAQTFRKYFSNPSLVADVKWQL